MLEVIRPVVAGIFSGCVIACLGYAKSVTVEDFEPTKALQTIIIGGFVGGAGVLIGMPYKEAYEYLVCIGAVTVVEYLKKAVWRLIKEYKEKQSTVSLCVG